MPRKRKETVSTNPPPRPRYVRVLRVTCKTCAQVEVPVSVWTKRTISHRRPGSCCEGLNCGCAKPLRQLCTGIVSDEYGAEVQLFVEEGCRLA